MSAKRLTWSVLAAGLLMNVSSAAIGDEVVVQAMAPWQGSGEIFAVAPGKLMIQASYTGIMYLQDQQGALDTALMHCPAVQMIDTNSKNTEASGHCMFTDHDEDVVYSDWNCTGAPGVCEGELTITGGTGKFEGISGGGKLLVRAALAETAVDLESGGMVRAAAGLAVWPDFKYQIPAK